MNFSIPNFEIRAEFSRKPENEKGKKFPFSVSYCHELNISQCWVSEQKGQSFVINIYNSLGQYIDKYIRVPVNHKHEKMFYNFRVIDSNGKLNNHFFYYFYNYLIFQIVQVKFYHPSLCRFQALWN